MFFMWPFIGCTEGQFHTIKRFTVSINEDDFIVISILLDVGNETSKGVLVDKAQTTLLLPTHNDSPSPFLMPTLNVSFRSNTTFQFEFIPFVPFGTFPSNSISIVLFFRPPYDEFSISLSEPAFELQS